MLTKVILRCLLPIAAVVLVACGDGGKGGDSDAGVADANTTPPTCDSPGAAPCPNNGVCFNGVCAPNACLLDINVCQEGDLCAMQCVPVGDACLGIECTDGSTCYQGTCVAGCFPPSPCLDVECGANQFCDGGSCFDLNPCEGECPAGEACNTFCRPISPCSGVECAADEVCVGGDCRVNPCFGVECAAGSICVNGTCLDTCEGCECAPFEDCVFGNCVCTPSCEGKTCGEDNGCGGLCNSCPTAGDVCDTGTGVCSCNSSCSGISCGQPNGCGDPCINNQGCQGGTCDGTVPTAPVCVCQGAGVEVCDDGDCCNATSDCIDTNGTGATDRCCTTTNICSEAANDQCCGGSQACVTGFGCCNNNDTCADTGGNCLCAGGEIAINCSNTNIGDEFCCANTTRACEQADAAEACCPSGFTCFDSNDSGTEQDTCCTPSSWCDDRQSCCNVVAGEICYNDSDNNPDNDSCCAPDCTGKSCGDDDGCGGRCDVETCAPGQTCLAVDPDSYSCQDDLCNPQCNPCSEICIAGSCESKCGNGASVDPLTCQCGGGID